MNKVERGSVWLVDLGFAAKTRPAVVFSVAFADSERALHTIVLHTTTRWHTQYEIEIPKSFLDKDGAFDAQQILNAPNAKFLKLLGKLSSHEMKQVEDLVKRWLNLT